MIQRLHTLCSIELSFCTLDSGMEKQRFPIKKKARRSVFLDYFFFCILIYLLGMD